MYSAGDRPAGGYDELEARRALDCRCRPASLSSNRVSVMVAFPTLFKPGAKRGADEAVSAGAGVVRSGEGLVADGTADQEEGAPVGIEEAAATGHGMDGAAAGVVLPRQVTLKRAVLHGDGTGRVIETAAAAKADATAPVPGDGLVADEGAVGDGDGQPVRGINAAARAMPLPPIA